MTVARKRPTRRGLLATAVVLACVSTATAAGVAAAGESSAPPAPATTGLSADAAPASVAFLRERYGIGEAEAVRRLELQRQAPALADRLAEQFPDEYAGMWLDQQAGGVLKVGAAGTGGLAAALGREPDAAHIRAVPVARSLRELTATALQLDATLADAGGAGSARAQRPEVAIDAATNSVVVTSAESVSALPKVLAGALRVAAGVRVDSTDSSTIDKACDPRYCARAPMHGGIRLDVTRDNGTYGGCTTGFNLRSTVTGDFFMLTAGHCVHNTNHANLDKTWHDLYGADWPVSEEQTADLAENNYPIDYAVMPYQAGAAAQWFRGRTPTSPYLVNDWCPGGCAGSHDVKITGMLPLESVQTGWVVCATGAGYTPAEGEKYVDSGAGAGYLPGTHCGQVIGTDTGGIGVNICARPGDSGGPLFTEADGMALGILSNGDPGEGPCDNPDERNYYAPLSKILERANTRTSDQFTLITAPPLTPPRGH